jgi:hypothetical protein
MKRGTVMQKGTIVSVAIVLTLFLVILPGCGSGEQTKNTSANNSLKVSGNTKSESSAKPKNNLQLKTVGFSPWSIENAYSVAGILFNPDKDLYATDVSLTITTFGANNVILDSRTENVDVVRPQQEQGFYTDACYDGGGAAERVDVQFTVDSWEKTTDSPTFTFENTNYLGRKVTGMIGTSSTKSMSKPRAVAVFLDPNGNAVGGAFTFVDNIPAGQKVPFDMSVSSTATPTSVKFFGQMTAITSSGS